MKNVHWLTALGACPAADVIALARRLSRDWTVTPKALPETGLGMLQLEDGACGENFYLGEFPLSTARVLVETDAGQTGEGAALVMSDQGRLAEALAICDAVLRNGLPGRNAVEGQIRIGVRRIEERDRRRRAMLSRTDVDFSLLDSSGQDSTGGEDGA